MRTISTVCHGERSFIIKPATTETLESAFSRLMKFATPHRKKLLVVEDNAAEQMSIRELLHSDDLDIESAETGGEALAAMRREPFDCAVLDLRLPDMTGFEVLEQMHADDSLQDTPVVVYTGKELSTEEETKLNNLARKVVVKGVESPERLLTKHPCSFTG